MREMALSVTPLNQKVKSITQHVLNRFWPLCTEEDISHSSQCADLDLCTDWGKANNNINTLGGVPIQNNQQLVPSNDSSKNRSSIRQKT